MGYNPRVGSTPHVQRLMGGLEPGSPTTEKPSRTPKQTPGSFLESHPCSQQCPAEEKDPWRGKAQLGSCVTMVDGKSAVSPLAGGFFVAYLLYMTMVVT